MSSNNTLYCSFCGKSQHEVHKLIMGPEGKVNICDECISLSVNIIHGKEELDYEYKGPDVDLFSKAEDIAGQMTPEEWETEKEQRRKAYADLESAIERVEEQRKKISKLQKNKQDFKESIDKTQNEDVKSVLRPEIPKIDFELNKLQSELDELEKKCTLDCLRFKYTPERGKAK